MIAQMFGIPKHCVSPLSYILFNGSPLGQVTQMATVGETVPLAKGTRVRVVLLCRAVHWQNS